MEHEISEGVGQGKCLDASTHKVRELGKGGGIDESKVKRIY